MENQPSYGDARVRVRIPSWAGNGVAMLGAKVLAILGWDPIGTQEGSLILSPSIFWWALRCSFLVSIDFLAQKTSVSMFTDYKDTI